MRKINLVTSYFDFFAPKIKAIADASQVIMKKFIYNQDVDMSKKINFQEEAQILQEN